MALDIFKQPEKYSDTTRKLSPAGKARETVDRRIGSVSEQAYNWRRIALGLLIACIVLSIRLTIQSLKSRIIPYVVTVDKSTGEVEKAGSLIAQEYTPQEAEVRYFIGQFIQNARNLQLDPVQQDKMQAKAYSFLTEGAARKYETIQENEGFKKKYALVTVQTKITSIKKIPDTDSYHAAWEEQEFTIADGKQTTRKYECVFSTTIIPPKDDTTLINNPLGLYISDLNFSSEIGTKTDSKKPTPGAGAVAPSDKQKQ